MGGTDSIEKGKMSPSWKNTLMQEKGYSFPFSQFFFKKSFIVLGE